MFVIRDLLADSFAGARADTLDLADLLTPSTFWNRGGGHACLGSSTVTSSHPAVSLSLVWPLPLVLRTWPCCVQLSCAGAPEVGGTLTWTCGKELMEYSLRQKARSMVQLRTRL